MRGAAAAPGARDSRHGRLGSLHLHALKALCQLQGWAGARGRGAAIGRGAAGAGQGGGHPQAPPLTRAAM